MTLGEKLQHLRWAAGTQRGYGRALTKADVARLMERELGAGKRLSAAYLSQLESGARSHMTERSRALLASFFKVHPGYLVSDPPGHEAPLPLGPAAPPVRSEDRLAAWLAEQAEAWRDDPLVAQVLLKLGQLPHPRQAFQMLNLLLDLPLEQMRLLFERAGFAGREDAG